MTADGASLELSILPLPESTGVAAGDAGVTAVLTPFDLAAAVASSPWWSEMAPATLIVRDGPRPALGILGRFTDLDRLRLGWLEQQVREVLPRMRIVTYSDAESACADLAEALTAAYGRSGLDRFAFRAIPRGGHIVLGMLAYLLDLDQAQLEATAHDRPLVVVDDCVLSGHRVQRYLQESSAPETIVASLYATPEVRAAIVARESRVSACVSGRDLRDHAEALLGDASGRWRERWSGRTGDRVYWTGMPDHVCFPWSEPDVTFWNPRTEREERGWPMAPPSRCLAHRGRAVAATPDIQVQPHGRGTSRPAPDVLFGTHGDMLVVGSLASGTSVVLDGVAVDMWKGLLDHDSLASAAASLATAYDAEVTTLERDLRNLVADLSERGFLTPDSTSA